MCNHTSHDKEKKEYGKNLTKSLKPRAVKPIGMKLSDLPCFLQDLGLLLQLEESFESGHS